MWVVVVDFAACFVGTERELQWILVEFHSEKENSFAGKQPSGTPATLPAPAAVVVSSFVAVVAVAAVVGVVGLSGAVAFAAVVVVA